MLPPVIHVDKNILLRPFDKKDVGFWNSWDTDYLIQRYMPEPKNTAVSNKEHYKYIKDCNNEEDGYYWSICFNNVAIGTISLFDIDFYHKTAEIGMVIGDKNYWGKGIGYVCLKSITQFAFKKLKLFRLSANVESGNIGMENILLKNEYKKEAVFEKARIKSRKRVDVLHFVKLNKN